VIAKDPKLISARLRPGSSVASEAHFTWVA
jgi:hypothetical protein